MEALDTPRRLAEWLTAMGYEGKIPTNLKPFCNFSTALLWEILINVVKPKQEIELVRNNILINRLSSSNSTSGIYQFKRESKYPIKEIEVCKKWHKLDKQVNAARDRINEIEAKLEGLTTNNKVKYVHLENVRQKIRENEQKTFLLKAKSKNYETEIDQVEDMLALARNLTPVESDTHNNEEVLDTLNKCAEKLKQIIEKQEAPAVAPSVIDGFEIRTPLRKRNRTFAHNLSSLFSSTKIGTQRKKKTKPSNDDSLGVLDEFSMTFDNALAASSFKDSQVASSGVVCYDWAILNDPGVSEMVREALHRFDRSLIWSTVLGLSEVSKRGLVDVIVQKRPANLGAGKTQKKDGGLVKLYALHVEYELKAMKADLNIAELEHELTQLQAKLTTKNQSHNQYLKLQQKEAGCIALQQHLHKTINSMQQSHNKQNPLKAIKEEARNLQENILTKLSMIEHKLKTFKETYETMMQARDETFVLTRKLGQFTSNCDWTEPLSACLNSTEIETFLKFPLEYNRKTTLSNTFFRDLPVNYIPHQDEFDSNCALIVVTILQNPSRPAESLLLDIVKTKLKTEQLKTLQYKSGDVGGKGYTLQQLQSQESYVAYAVDKLQSLVNAMSSDPTRVLQQTRDVIHLWLEMPTRNFVSPNRLFNTLPYKHYDEMFEKFYQQL